MYINPYENVKKGTGDWLKANFHTHAGTGKNTCGAYEIDDVVSLYKEAGYKVLTISNHDIYTDTKQYSSKHGITLINGFEYSLDEDPHMLCIGVENHISGSHQEIIDECNSQKGFVILCHPNWYNKEYWSETDLASLRDYAGIEIFNGVIFRLAGSGLAVDKWDYLLSSGKKVWGFGSDDFHRWFDFTKAWNVIYSETQEQADIIESIKNGSFYVSTGLILNDFSFSDGVLEIKAHSYNTYIKNYKYLFIGQGGEILSEQNAEYAKYVFSGDEEYVRVQVISEHGAMLWTQPITTN